MKVAITVLHGNITNKNLKSVGNNETLHLAKLLRKYCEVDFLSCKDCDECITVDENYDICKYDKFLIVNGSVNMFGGQEIKTATTIYKLIHKFDKQIYYILTDLLMPFVDYSKHIENKEWNNYRKDEFTPKYPISIISQFKDVETIKKIHRDVEISNIYYLPLSYWYLSFYEKDLNFDLCEKTSDLIYGGSFRAGNRLEKMKEYFFDMDIDVELYGNIRLSQFKDITFKKSPKFSGKVKPNEVIAKNSTSFSTIIIGDKKYNNNTITLRVIESLLSDCIVFIDDQFDPNHKILNSWIYNSDYLYVNTGKELSEKIVELKNNKDLYNQMMAVKKESLEKMKEFDLGKELATIIC